MKRPRQARPVDDRRSRHCFLTPPCCSLAVSFSFGGLFAVAAGECAPAASSGGADAVAGGEWAPAVSSRGADAVAAGKWAPAVSSRGADAAAVGTYGPGSAHAVLTLVTCADEPDAGFDAEPSEAIVLAVADAGAAWA